MNKLTEQRLRRKIRQIIRNEPKDIRDIELINQIKG